MIKKIALLLSALYFGGVIYYAISIKLSLREKYEDRYVKEIRSIEVKTSETVTQR